MGSFSVNALTIILFVVLLIVMVGAIVLHEDVTIKKKRSALLMRN